MVINYKIESASRIGGRAENQDCFRISEFQYGLLAVVCDGMGGANGGKIAAELAVNRIFEEVSGSTGENPKAEIRNAIAMSNDAIFNESMKNPGLSGMGTTLTALLIMENHALAFHVGDSRIYQLRKANILFRTFDHSRVFELVRLGILTEEEARVSPKSNIITRALGTSPGVEITVSEPLIYKKGDRFLLCTDGIWGTLPETELMSLVALERPVSEVLNNLIGYIDRIGIEAGGMHDNMTAILIEI